MIDETQARPASVNLSILKALDVLECLHQQGPSLSPAQIAHHVGLARPTVYRLLSTMALRGWVVKDPQTEGNYRLGYHILTIAGTMLQRMDLRLVARPFIEELAQRHGESVAFFMLDGVQVVHLDFVSSPSRFQAVLPLGSRGCLHSKGVGKAILACFGDQQVEEMVLRCGLTAVTPHTITDLPTLLADLRLVRQRGYGIVDEEDVEGLRAVGAAISNLEGFPIGGIAISGLVQHLDTSRLQVLGEAVRDTAREISLRLGYVRT
jgi:DNA-binding IclR family transcriptional regulator